MPKPPTDQTEAAYHDRWHAMYAQQVFWTPFALAVAGGGCAGNLAQVFIAGYQAAIRATFADTPLTGWAAFVVSEDRSAVDPLPGVTAQLKDNTYVLNGYKSWIAAVQFVQSLVVRAGGEHGGYYLVARSAPGLTLDANPSPSMLPQLSQGRAQFSNVRVSPEQCLDQRRVKHFGAVEAFFIQVAFAAFAQQAAAAASETESEQLAGVLQGQASALDVTQDPAGAAKLDTGVQQLRLRLAESLFAADSAWQRDQRLIAMYSKGIQARGSA